MTHFFEILIFCLVTVFLFFYFVATLSAEELPKDCTYVPKPSDLVYYTCSEGAVGTVYLKVWICGQPYTIDAKCPR